MRRHPNHVYSQGEIFKYVNGIVMNCMGILVATVE